MYFSQRWPSKTSVERVKQRVKKLAPNAACHRDLREAIARMNPVICGGGSYFATGMHRRSSTRSTLRLGKAMQAGAAPQKTEPEGR